MAYRKIEIGETVTIRHGTHKGKSGTVIGREQRKVQVWDTWRQKYWVRSLLTYEVDVDGLGMNRVRRLPGSHLDLIFMHPGGPRLVP